MEVNTQFLTEEEKLQVEYLESLLFNLNTSNMCKVVRKIKNTQFKTRNQLQYLSDLIFKFVSERHDKIADYAYLCKEVKDLKVTILRFETIDEKESLEIASLRFHILLATRVEIAYDQLGAVKEGFKHFAGQENNESLLTILRVAKHQMAFAGELYQHDLISTEFLFAIINRLSIMAESSGFSLECFVSILEQTARGVEAKNFSLGRYFKQLRNIARKRAVDGVLMERIKDLLKLRASKWMGGEEEVPPEFVECLTIDETYKQKTLKAIEEELKKYILMNKCSSCCLEFEPSDRIRHLISKQHTTSIQTLLRDQYDGNLISCRERTCVICQEIDIAKPFAHFNTQQHKINCTTFCYICQTKFKSAFFLAMHLKSLVHRKELLRVYDKILQTKLLDGLIAKEKNILASDDSDNDDAPQVDFEKYDKMGSSNAALKNNIFRYLHILTAENEKPDSGLHDKVIEQLDKFIENVYVSKNISAENTAELVKQFNQDVEDVRATLKCVRGEFPMIADPELAKNELVPQINLVRLLKDQYSALCADMKVKLEQLQAVKKGHSNDGSDDPSNVDTKGSADCQSVQDNSEAGQQILQQNVEDGVLKTESAAPDGIVETEGASATPDDTERRLLATIGTINALQENMTLLYMSDNPETIMTNEFLQNIHKKSGEKTEDQTNKVMNATENINNPKDCEENKNANVTKEKVCTCENRKSISKSGKNKKKGIKSKKLMAENISNTKICHLPRQKCKGETPCEPNLAKTAKCRQQAGGSSNYQTEDEARGTTNAPLNNLKCEESSPSSSTTNQEGSREPDLLSKNDNSFTEGAKATETQEVIKTQPPSTTLPNLQGVSSPQKHPARDEQLSELKVVRIKTFAVLKRKVADKLRTEGSSSSKNTPIVDKIIVEVTNVIKRTYMSDDLPLRVILELFQNFNRDLEKKFRGRS